MDSTEIRKILVSKQGNYEEDLKLIGGKNSADLTKEEVFDWMRLKAKWELVTELLGQI